MPSQTISTRHALSVLVMLAFGYIAIAQEEASPLPSREPPSQMNLDGPGDVDFQLIYIKPGTFEMGIDTKFWRLGAALGGTVEYLDDGPPHKVTITKGYYIAKYKVTTAQYCSFLNAVEDAEKHIVFNKFSNITTSDGQYVPKAGAEDCAVNTVPWEGAVAFCRWLSEQTGRTVRLPTEAEWEFAARGTEGRRYPWGNEELPRGQQWERDWRDEEKYPHPWSCAPVDAFPSNSTPEGVVGMAGFVGEWVLDYYAPRHPDEPQIDPLGPAEPLGGNDGNARVLRRGMPRASARSPADRVRDDAGVYGFRILVEHDGSAP